MLVLTILQGPEKGRHFDLPDDEPQMIGRSSESLPLRDQTISRRHAELTPDDGKWFIRDLNSSNGTFVNGVRVTDRLQLHNGDQIRTGTTLIAFGETDQPQTTSGVRVVPKRQIETDIHSVVASSDDSMIMAVSDPNEAAALQLRVLYELTQLIGSIVDRSQLLERIMDVVFEYFRADRGFVLLQDSPDQRPDPVVVRHRQEPGAPPSSRRRPITVSRTIVRYVLQKSMGVLSSNAMTDVRFASGESVQEFGIRSALCAPIQFKDRLYGVIYLDSRVANYTYTEDQLRLLTAVGVETGMALANAEMHEHRVREERLAAVGETVASLSHSIKNILQGLRGGADVVELGLRKGSLKVVHGGWQIVARNLARIYELTMNMLAFSTQRRPERELTNLPKLLQECVALVQKQYDARQVALLTDFAEDMPPVPIDPSGIYQAAVNLLNNGLDAVEPNTGAVSVSCDYNVDQQLARIRINDNGAGIDAQQIERLYEPFHSTKGLRGTGLGLVVTKKIIEEHGGKLDLDSSSNEGTTFTLTLPCDAAAIEASADTEGPAAMIASARTIAMNRLDETQ
ncbi:MAG: ATP-binding protein [Phycisphaeraceae bacterium]